MKPDFKETATCLRKKWFDSECGVEIAADIERALQDAYAAGLDEAVDIIAETCRVRLLNINDANTYIADILREKGTDHG